VGRLWFGKGLGDLLSAYKSVRESRDDVSLLIVGDGVDEDRLRLQAGKLDGVVFAGFVQPRDLPSFYALADVFVFPTLGDPNGLVVEEALAAGLPVISTEAAGDIHSRVAEANVGFVVPVSDVNELADRMKVLIDPSVRLPMSEIASQSVSHMRDAGYAKDFCQFVTLVGSTSPRRNVASVALRGIGALALVSAKRWKWTAAPYVHNANYEVQNATDR
jgi:glycosyltransferase involved in cell wall biosynthesis